MRRYHLWDYEPHDMPHPGAIVENNLRIGIMDRSGNNVLMRLYPHRAQPLDNNGEREGLTKCQLLKWARKHGLTIVF